MSFEGVHTPLVTPFKEDGEIDHALLGKHAANLAGRVSGLGIGGTTGEYYALSFEERVKTFNTVAEVARMKRIECARAQDRMPEGCVWKDAAGMPG